MIDVEDRLKLSPLEFKAALKECFSLLPFKLVKPVKVIVQQHQDKIASPDKQVSLGFGDVWTVNLYAEGLNAAAPYNKLYFWLFATLSELAHVHRMERIPASRGNDDECKKIAQETLQRYKEDWFIRR